MPDEMKNAHENTGGVCRTERSFPARVAALDSVLDFVNGCAEAVCSDNRVLMALNLCVEEAFVNVASYAYGEKEGDALISVETEENAVSVSISDSGSPFDPLAAPDPDVNELAENERIGGLGIFMIKKQMDEVSYRYENGRNIFIMKKIIK